jgi:methyl coenzyme M reductase subunit C-like uncharacterized protein (methanogenesis marker protein 7)
MASKSKITPGKQKVKPFTGKPAKALKVVEAVGESLIPKSLVDVAMYAVPYGKATRMIGGIAGKGARAVSKLYRNMGR